MKKLHQHIQKYASDAGYPKPYPVSAKSNLGDIASNTGDIGAIKASVLDSKEDLKYMIDLATEAAIDRYAAANVKVEIHNTNTINNEMDIDGVVDKLNESLTETIAITSRGVHK